MPNHTQPQHQAYGSHGSHGSHGSDYATAPRFQETQFLLPYGSSMVYASHAYHAHLYLHYYNYQPQLSYAYHAHPYLHYYNYQPQLSHAYHAHPYLHYYNYQPQLYVPMVGVAETLSILYQAHPFENQQQQQQQQLLEEILLLDEDGELVNFNRLISPDEEDVRIECMEDVFQNLKTQTYAHDELEGNADMCVVCQEVYENNETIATLQCGHEYHVECIKTWLSRNRSCPICRAQEFELPSDSGYKKKYPFRYSIHRKKIWRLEKATYTRLKVAE